MNSKLFDLFETSSWPGVPILIRSKQMVAKTVWLVCILILAGFCIYYVNEIFQSYYKYEVITNIDVIREEPSQFPAISFCMQLNDTKFASNTSNIILFCSFGYQKCSLKDFEFYSFRDLYFSETFLKDAIFRWNMNFKMSLFFKYNFFFTFSNK